jgi:hypothetical protein
MDRLVLAKYRDEIERFSVESDRNFTLSISMREQFERTNERYRRLSREAQK